MLIVLGLEGCDVGVMVVWDKDGELSNLYVFSYRNALLILLLFNVKSCLAFHVSHLLPNNLIHFHN